MWLFSTLFAVDAALVWHGHVPALDRSLSADIVQQPGSALFRLGESISFVGSGGAVVAVALLVGIVVWRRAGNVILAAATPVAAGAAGVLELVFKDVVGRLRPVTAFFTGESGFGFPSGHTTGFTAMAVTAGGVFVLFGVAAHRRRTVWFVVVAASVLVGLGRVLVGAHYVLDVIGGLGLGTSSGFGVLWAATGPIGQRLAPISQRLAIVARRRNV